MHVLGSCSLLCILDFIPSCGLCSFLKLPSPQPLFSPHFCSYCFSSILPQFSTNGAEEYLLLQGFPLKDLVTGKAQQFPDKLHIYKYKKWKHLTCYNLKTSALVQEQILDSYFCPVQKSLPA